MNAVAQAMAFWLTAAGEGKLLSESLPEPGAQDVLVRMLYSAVSRCTEALVFRGEVSPSD